MNLGKKYKQLFEGKVRSNDSRLLKEEYDENWHIEVAKAYEVYARKNQLKGIIYSEQNEEIKNQPNASPAQISKFVEDILYNNYETMEDWISGINGTGQIYPDVKIDMPLDKIMDQLYYEAGGGYRRDTSMVMLVDGYQEGYLHF